MDLRDQQRAEEDAGYRKTRAGVALVLITMGIVGVLWIVEQILVLVSGPQDVPLIAKFLAFDPVARTLVTPAGNYQLPEGLYFAAGFFLHILVLSVAAALAKALIASGASLMGQDVASALNHLRDEMRRLKEHLESRNK